MFSPNQEKGVYSAGRCKDVSEIIFGKLWIWGTAICVCVQSVFSADAATSWRHNTLLKHMALVNTMNVYSVEVVKASE